jgi:hypothetical protein
MDYPDYRDVAYMEIVPDPRNATRPVVISQGTRGPRPVSVAPVPHTVASSAPYMYPQYPTGQSAMWWGYPTNPNYAVPQPQSNLGTILSGFGDLGTLVNIVAQAFAAFLPLPAAPDPHDSTDNDMISSNTLANSVNLIKYQNALAQFARRDQQILTLGSVVKELLKRPGTVG